eukprot:m.103326 g.103326  ORF g.103326 m.103326 type:complete len:116 (+) comp13805_c0_seq12:1613-1960(+)
MRPVWGRACDVRLHTSPWRLVRVTVGHIHARQSHDHACVVIHADEVCQQDGESESGLRWEEEVHDDVLVGNGGVQCGVGGAHVSQCSWEYAHPLHIHPVPYYEFLNNKNSVYQTC